MRFFSILEKGLQAMLDEALIPNSFIRGEQFENYVRKYLFIKDHYDLVDRTPKYDRHDFAESCRKPDFKFRDKLTHKEFYVEVKFRSSVIEGKIDLFKEGQLARYKKYSKYMPVFILFGLGEDPNDPKLISLIPAYALKYNDITYGYAKKFEIPKEKIVESMGLWK